MTDTASDKHAAAGLALLRFAGVTREAFFIATTVDITPDIRRFCAEDWTDFCAAYARVHAAAQAGKPDYRHGDGTTHQKAKLGTRAPQWGTWVHPHTGSPSFSFGTARVFGFPPRTQHAYPGGDRRYHRDWRDHQHDAPDPNSPEAKHAAEVAAALKVKRAKFDHYTGKTDIRFARDQWPDFCQALAEAAEAAAAGKAYLAERNAGPAGPEHAHIDKPTTASWVVWVGILHSPATTTRRRPAYTVYFGYMPRWGSRSLSPALDGGATGYRKRFAQWKRLHRQSYEQARPKKASKRRSPKP